MKSLAITCSPNRLVIASLVSVALSGCDGGTSLIITDSGDSAADQMTIDAGAEATAEVGSATSIAVDDTVAVDETAESIVVENTIESADDAVVAPVLADDEVSTDNDASGGSVAAAYLADRSALGPIKIMAVGDSITHGVSGVSSYRKEFTAQISAASCNFTMVGSQQTSYGGGGDPECIDTGVIGDGWGWDGTQSCLVGTSSSTEVYVGAHEGYSAHRADHFLTGHVSSAGTNDGIQVAMESYSPDVVLLHIGSVDLFNRQGVGNALNDIEDVLDTIYTTQPQTLVLIANLIPWFSNNPYPAITSDIVRLGDGIEQIVAERYDPLLKLVDVRSGYTESMMLNDLIHPNATGEAHIADAFVSTFLPLANCVTR